MSEECLLTYLIFNDYGSYYVKTFIIQNKTVVYSDELLQIYLSASYVAICYPCFSNVLNRCSNARSVLCRPTYRSSLTQPEYIYSFLIKVSSETYETHTHDALILLCTLQSRGSRWIHFTVSVSDS